MDHSKWKNIDTLIFDVDGVFTDGRIHVTESGELLRTFHVRDSMALKKALQCGYKVAIITKGKSKGVRKILTEFGVEHMYDDISDKSIPFQELITFHGFDPDTALYMGDDLPDLVVLKEVHLACCPQDAAPEVCQAVDYISPNKGGASAVRDVIENVLRARGDW